MHIGIIGSYPPSYGGQSIHIQQLKRYVDQHGGFCTVLNTGENQRVMEPQILNFHKMFFLLLHLLKRPYQIVHVHVAGYQNYEKLMPPYIVSALRGTKWMVTFHSGNTMLAETGPAKRWSVNLMLRRANKIICVNSSIKESLIQQGVAGRNCTVIPAFSLNLNLYRESLEDEVEYFLNNHSPIITSIGMFEPLYGFELLFKCGIELKKYFGKMGIIVIASGGTQQRNSLGSIKKLCIQDNVMVLENIRHEQCLQVIGRSDLFARPTLYDGDAICVREALSLGTPVIATRTAFRPPGVVLFDIEDQSSMFQAAIEVLKRERKKKSSTIVEDERFLKSVMQVYKSVLKQ